MGKTHRFQQKTVLKRSFCEAYGLEHLVGKGITITVDIDHGLDNVHPDALSQRLGHFLGQVLDEDYVRGAGIKHSGYSISTTVDPWPLPRTAGEIEPKQRRLPDFPEQT